MLVVVIGSGLSGSLLCNDLVQHCDVTLLERGPKGSIKIPDIQCINKDLAEVSTFCFGQGGTTNLWHNGLIPINTNDVTSENFQSVLIDIKPYMDRAASDLFFKNVSYLVEYEKVVAEVNSLSDKFYVFPYGIDCLIYPKKLKKLMVDPGVRCIYDVKNIDFIFDDNRIAKINYTSKKQTGSIEADIVVVACGGMGTPNILQKIFGSTGNSTSTAGLGFIDHPAGFVGKVRFKKNISRAFKKLSYYDKGDYISRNAVRLKSDCGRYTSCAFFRPALTMANNLAVYKYKSALGASGGVDRLKTMFSTKLFHPDILAEIFAHLFGFNIPSRTYNIFFIGEQKRGSNRVNYNGDELEVDWNITEEEISIYNDMLISLKDMIADMTDEINIKTDINPEWLWSAAHHSGTTSMGDSEDCLIDHNLKLKCCDNVFVCDGSVIQEHSYANTGLTIGQLALRLADRLREEVI